MRNKELVWLYIFIGICAIITLPLLGDQGFLFPLGRDIIFRIIVEIILGLYIILLFLDKKYLPKFDWLSLSLIVFWLANGLATIFSLQPEFSFWGNPFRGHGFFSLTHYLIFFIILNSVIKTKFAWKKIIWLSILTSIPIILVSLAEILSLTSRTQSTLNNPNFLAAYLLLIFFITLGVLLKEKNCRLRLFLTPVLGLQLLAIIFTKTRGAYVGLALGLITFFLFYLYFRGYKKILYSSLISFLLIFILASILFMPWFLRSINLPHNEMPSRFMPIKERLESYRTAWQGIKERPLLGVGPENFVIVFDKYYSGSLGGSGYPWFDKVHNIFLEIAVTSGIFSLIAYMFSIFFAIKYLIKSKINLIKIALIATLVAYLAQNQFNIDTVSSLIYFYLYLSLAIFLKTHEIK